MPVFPKVGESITVGFIRRYKSLERGESDGFDFLYNGGWLHVTVIQTDFYDRATHIKIEGKDADGFKVLAKMGLARRGSSNVWHDLKKLADPDYDHPFKTGMGNPDMKHPFHLPGPEPLVVS